MVTKEEEKFDNDSFRIWWEAEGSITPFKPGQRVTSDDIEETIKQKARIAWLNGAYKAREKIEKEAYEKYKKEKKEE